MYENHIYHFVKTFLTFQNALHISLKGSRTMSSCESSDSESQEAELSRESFMILPNLLFLTAGEPF